MLREKLILSEIKDIENEIIEYWKEHHIKEKWYERPSKNQSVVYDGPPTANGYPGLHHLISKSYKDSLQRFFHMRGDAISDFIAFDTHGLPVELAVEKKFNIQKNTLKSKKEISLFNQRCKEHVEENIAEFKKIFNRFGAWHQKTVVTCSKEYINTVWSSLSLLFKKGLVYQDYRVFYFCTSCRTPLSSHEVSQGYKDTEDPSLYFLVNSKRFNAQYIVWTTTPWSIAGNRALAVNREGEYLLILHNDKRFICSANMVDTLFPEKNFKIIERHQGKNLEGDRYNSPITIGIHSSGETIADDEVDINTGSGIVHIAPPFGEYDWSLHLKFNLDFKNPLEDNGKFNIKNPKLNGLYFYDANKIIIELLQQNNNLFKNLKAKHSYPFCWRCDTRLIQFPTSAWLIKAKSVRANLLRTNNSVDWRPLTIGEGRFGQWLEKNVDWVISRNRYWGTPLPIWQCKNKHYYCISSYQELAEITGKDISDLHRPYIDTIEFLCKECEEKMTRVTQILDVWYDSAALPFAAYEVKDIEKLGKYYPSKFVAEGIDQTRGWFYTLLLLGILLGNYKAYSSVIVIGLLLDAQGRKMSKRLNNIIKPELLFEKYGADITRCFLLYQKRHWINRSISEKQLIDLYGRIIVPYFNSILFLHIYVNSYNWQEEDYSYLHKESKNIYQNKDNFVDMWLLTLREKTINKVIEFCNNLKPADALNEIEDFLTQLSTIYIRMNRERFWKEDSRVITILKDTLLKINILTAPFLPFFSEYLYLNYFKGKYKNTEHLSIHLMEYPRVEKKFIKVELIEEMNLLQKVVTNIRMLRNKNNIPLKQPLPFLALTSELFYKLKTNNMLELIEKEVNLLEIKLLSKESLEKNIIYIFKANYKTISKDFGKSTKLIADYINNKLTKENYKNLLENNILKIDCADNIKINKSHVILRKDLIQEKEHYFIDTDNSVYYLSTKLNEDLINEGALRHLLHKIQNQRKENKLHISDRINLLLICKKEIFKTFLERKSKPIAQELLCKEIKVILEDNKKDLSYLKNIQEFSYRDIKVKFQLS